jgi:type IV secretion system protein VirB4
VKEHLWTALGSLADAPVAQRTLTGLTALIHASGLKRALAPYTLSGSYGRLLDGDIEHFGESAFQTFETEGLAGTPPRPRCSPTCSTALSAASTGGRP